MHTILVRYFFIKYIFTSKPCLINQIVLSVTNPRRGKNLSHIPYTYLLEIGIFLYSRNYDIFMFSSNELGVNWGIVFIIFPKVSIIMRCPENIVLCSVITQKCIQYIRILFSYVIF